MWKATLGLSTLKQPFPCFHISWIQVQTGPEGMIFPCSTVPEASPRWCRGRSMTWRWLECETTWKHRYSSLAVDDGYWLGAQVELLAAAPNSMWLGLPHNMVTSAWLTLPSITYTGKTQSYFHHILLLSIESYDTDSSFSGSSAKDYCGHYFKSSKDSSNNFLKCLLEQSCFNDIFFYY